MPDGAVIRAARLADAAGVFELVARNRELLVPRSLGNIVGSIDRFTVAVAGGAVVGCAAFEVHPEIGRPEAASVEICSLAVDGAWRRRGIGRSLVEAVVERVKSFGPREVMVLTFAAGFFAALGFEEFPKTEVMHKLYTGCMNCTKHTNPYTCPEVAMRRAVP